MATEEIEISELELAEELASDNLIPVESATDTKATSLQILKNWLSSFFVGKTGNENISGVKNFANVTMFNDNVYSVRNYAKNRDSRYVCRILDKGFDDLPEQVCLGGFHTFDKDNNEFSTAYSALNPNGIVETNLWVKTKNGSPTTIGIMQRPDGTTLTKTPTPPVTDNSTQIANTNWVRQLLSHEVTQEGGYFNLTNDTMVQFGAINTYQGSNVNLPKPFANNNYKVVISGYTTQTTGSANYASIINTTTTGFTVVPAQVGSFAWVAIGMK